MATVVEISADQLDNLIAGGCTVVDVRSAEDYAGGHIPGAVNIPAGALSEDPGQLTGLIDSTASANVALVCLRGRSSRDAAEAIAEAPALADLAVIHSLGGGTVAWEDAGHTLEGAE
ncbi:rhodanese-like domain-containing protein [uncultured Corynebacterium sp.]|uniref:rhodanese-like domain-containing protein n=1 Tax=uncultured Corynebacterium sp. TaxID=159447 RepID=UPI0025E6CF51|nr:rhodanese-like domain-containing protein [uncultured Corynebacterium sp.]